MQTTYKQAESLKKRGDELHHREKHRNMYPGGYGQYAEFKNIDRVITKSQQILRGILSYHNHLVLYKRVHGESTAKLVRQIAAFCKRIELVKMNKHVAHFASTRPVVFRKVDAMDLTVTGKTFGNVHTIERDWNCGNVE